MKIEKRLCTDVIYNHLSDGVEHDRKRLSAQWKMGKINPLLKNRYENNLRKLLKYEDEFLTHY